MLASALCLIICPDSVSAGGAANAVPAQVKSLAAGSCKASRGSWRTLRGLLFCPGGYPYCWYAIFKEQRGAIRSPSLSSRKLRSVNTLIRGIFKKLFEIPQDAVSPLDDRPLADAHSLGVFPCRRAVEEQGVDEFPVGIL